MANVTSHHAPHGAPSYGTDADLLLPGMKPVLELLAATPQRVSQVYCRKGLTSPDADEVRRLCRKHGIRCNAVDAGTLDRLCGRPRRGHAVAHQGVAARLAATEFTSLGALLQSVPDAPLPLLLALDQVQDPGNVGTLCRTLYALGGAGLLVPSHNSAYLGPAARRTAAGALERLPVAHVTNLAHALDNAEEAGLAVYGTGCGTGDAGCVDAFTTPMELPAVLVLGNEDKGLRPGVAKRCATFLRIPFARDFDSLNVAQAGAILMGLAAQHHAQKPVR
ncbi:MAG: RNA methyltransferase [Desulfovibrio sp.]|uniref:TrmH family RNA methyltransferase n=1 Tax=Desulfovibrio sp. TaxID=885 RepID=UPI001A67FCB8|nr:RNA methyltransferase [Desulfovibrio sp.]MBD5417652.1 RNA methyltransferase [Desulfovibrio sp.]